MQFAALAAVHARGHAAPAAPCARHPPQPDPAQRLGDLGGVEGGRVETLLVQAGQHLVVHAVVLDPLLAPVPDDHGARALPVLITLEQLGQSPHAAEVLGGGHGPAPTRAHRALPLALLGGAHLLHRDPVQPVVAEVVGVVHAVAGARQDVREGGLVLVEGRDAEVSRRGIPAARTVLEDVQVRVVPAERHLDHGVQGAQRDVRGHHEPPPD